MENLERDGFRATWAPRALVWWRMQPSLAKTLRRFALFSKHNVLAGRQRYWHYGVARQYAAAAAFVALAVLISRWWLLALAAAFVVRIGRGIWRRRGCARLALVHEPASIYCRGGDHDRDRRRHVCPGWAQALTTTAIAIVGNASRLFDMKPKLLDWLVCPACGSTLAAVPFEQDGDEILEGLLKCSCGRVFPIVNSIPRILDEAFNLFPDFVVRHRERLAGVSLPPPTSNAAAESIRRTRESFGYQWTEFSEMVIDFRENFLEYIHPVQPEFFRGKARSRCRMRLRPPHLQRGEVRRGDGRRRCECGHRFHATGTRNTFRTSTWCKPTCSDCHFGAGSSISRTALACCITCRIQKRDSVSSSLSFAREDRCSSGSTARSGGS